MNIQNLLSPRSAATRFTGSDVAGLQALPTRMQKALKTYEHYGYTAECKQDLDDIWHELNKYQGPQATAIQRQCDQIIEAFMNQINDREKLSSLGYVLDASQYLHVDYDRLLNCFDRNLDRLSRQK